MIEYSKLRKMSNYKIVDMSKEVRKVAPNLSYRQNPELLPQHPFHMLITAPTGGGKTNLVLNMLFKLGLQYDVVHIVAKNPNEDKWLYAQKQLQKEERKTKKITGIDYKMVYTYNALDQIPTIEELVEIENPPQSVMIIDDFVNEKNQQVLQDLYIGCRKVNMSIIYLSQDYYKVPTEIRRNVYYSVFFRGNDKRSMKQICQNLSGQLGEEKFTKLLYHCTESTPYGFFLVDLKTENPKLRYRCGFNGILHIDQEQS